MDSRKRALSFALMTILVIAAGLLPACACLSHGCCSSQTDPTTSVSEAPCCEPSFAPSETSRDHAAMTQAAAPVVVIAQANIIDSSPLRAPIVFDRTSHHHERTAPIFLLNAQLLI